MLPNGILFIVSILVVHLFPGKPVSSVEVAEDSTLRVMSFNIRYNNPGDGPNAWPHRKETVASVIRFHEADLVGLQEAQKGMLAQLDSLLPGFDWFGPPRSTGDAGDEYTAILYRTDRLELLDQGAFWLSETPDVRASKGWDAALPRNATWGKFRDRSTGEIFFHLNTHFDHMGKQARAESARLLQRKLAEIAGSAPVVVTGDFNTGPDSAPYRVLTSGAEGASITLRDAMEVSILPHHGPTATWNGFEEISPGQRIDFIFVNDGVRVLRHGILSEITEDGRFPSDHLPVLAEVDIL